MVSLISHPQAWGKVACACFLTNVLLCNGTDKCLVSSQHIKPIPQNQRKDDFVCITKELEYAIRANDLDQSHQNCAEEPSWLKEHNHMKKHNNPGCVTQVLTSGSYSCNSLGDWSWKILSNDKLETTRIVTCLNSMLLL